MQPKKRLHLAKETIRNLQSYEMGNIAGGSTFLCLVVSLSLFSVIYSETAPNGCTPRPRNPIAPINPLPLPNSVGPSQNPGWGNTYSQGFQGCNPCFEPANG